MGMNEEILNHPISNWGPWFLPELVLLENSYQMRPWVIPDKLLFVNINIINRINRNENIGEKKKKKINFNRKLKGSFLISSNFEFKNRNQDEKEPVAGQGDRSIRRIRTSSCWDSRRNIHFEFEREGSKTYLFRLRGRNALEYRCVSCAWISIW